jgi:hypothetical protein
VVHPTGNALPFAEQLVAYGGCLRVNQFGWIEPGVGAVNSHEFVDTTGSTGFASAGVFNTRYDPNGVPKCILLFAVDDGTIPIPTEPVPVARP